MAAPQIQADYCGYMGELLQFAPLRALIAGDQDSAYLSASNVCVHLQLLEYDHKILSLDFVPYKPTMMALARPAKKARGLTLPSAFT